MKLCILYALLLAESSLLLMSCGGSRDAALASPDTKDTKDTNKVAVLLNLRTCQSREKWVSEYLKRFPAAHPLAIIGDYNSDSSFTKRWKPFSLSEVQALVQRNQDSMDYNAKVFHPWGWEDAADAKAHLEEYSHILIARIDDDQWEDRGPHRLTPHHFEGTVVKSYKGDWRVSERIAFVHHVDAPAPTNRSSAPHDELIFVFTNQHTNAEIVVDTGEFGTYNAEYALALDHIFPQKTNQ